MQHEFQIILIPLTLSALDVVSGYIAAIRTGTVNSTVMRDGMWTKIGEMLAIVVVKAIEICISVFGADFVGMEITVPLLPLFCGYLAIYEITSNIENIGKMNPTVGKWLIEHIGIDPHKVNQFDSWHDDSDIK